MRAITEGRSAELVALGRRIRRRRLDIDITQTEMARRAGITSGAACMFERGQRGMRRETLGRIAEALETTTISLSGGPR